jgi:hypothetical protein
MEQQPTTTATAAESAAATQEPKTDAERYPLIKDPLYRRCLDQVIGGLKAQINAAGGSYKLKTSPIVQLERAGELSADFCLEHFAGIFDKTSQLTSAKRAAVKAILTEAAGRMAEITGEIVKKQHEAETKKKAEEAAATPEPQAEDAKL